MAERELSFSERFLARHFMKNVGRSICKILTELITNSDDSYKRLKESKRYQTSTESLLKSIIIKVDHRPRNKGIIQVIDYAEGLTEKKMDDKFGDYGADKSGQNKDSGVRGLFGQGLAAVLFTQIKPNVRSIKDDKAYECKFYWKDGKPMINPKRSKARVDYQLRKAWGIPNSNGTCVEFKLQDGVSLPQHDKLLRRLNIFYPLRFVNSDLGREVKLISIYSNRKLYEDELRYEFPVGEVLDKKTFEMRFEDYSPVKIEAEIMRSESPLPQGIEDREGGLLIFDEKRTVYDLTLFKYDSDLHNLEHLFGFVKLTGAREIIKDRLDNYKEEILTETRDGLNRKHLFYKKLAEIIERWLAPIVRAERRRTTSIESQLSEEIQKEHLKAFEEMNKAYNEMIEKIEFVGTDVGPGSDPPAGGLEFARTEINTTVGKKYGLLLRININLIPVGSTIEIKSNNLTIQVFPDKFTINESLVKDGIYNKTIIIRGFQKDQQGLVTAKFGDRQAQVFVKVIPEDIFIPEEGLSFHPNYFRAQPGKRSKLKLFLDMGKIGTGSTIGLERTSENIKLDETKIVVTEDMRVYYDVAKVDISFIGYGFGQESRVIASVPPYEDTAFIRVDKKKPPKPRAKTGKFRGWRFESMPGWKAQTSYDSDPESDTYGYILVNTEHPINKKYFGDEPETRKSAVEKLPHCQVYLAELILNQCLDVMIVEAYEKNDIERRYSENPHLDIVSYISEKKYELGPVIHTYIVRPNLLSALEEKGLENISVSL